jgi:hypothetical protein
VARVASSRTVATRSQIEQTSQRKRPQQQRSFTHDTDAASERATGAVSYSETHALTKARQALLAGSNAARSSIPRHLHTSPRSCSRRGVVTGDGPRRIASMARVLLSAGLMGEWVRVHTRVHTTVCVTRRCLPAAAGYKGFGSFHSDNVEEMLAAPDDAYVAPPPLIPFDDAVRDAASGVELGRAFARHFLLDLATWTFVNHGAFGGSLTLMLDLAERWRRECERQPLLFIDRLLFPQLVVSIRKIARFVGVDRRELVFVANATTGYAVAAVWLDR